MYRTDFWTLWEKARVGCSERTALGWRGRQEGGLGWGTHLDPWLIHVNVWNHYNIVK